MDSPPNKMIKREQREEKTEGEPTALKKALRALSQVMNTDLKPRPAVEGYL